MTLYVSSSILKNTAIRDALNQHFSTRSSLSTRYNTITGTIEILSKPLNHPSEIVAKIELGGRFSRILISYADDNYAPLVNEIAKLLVDQKLCLLNPEVKKEKPSELPYPPLAEPIQSSA